MFRLLRYFSITSFVAMALVTLLLGMFYRWIAINELMELAESRNVALTQAFANSLWPRFAPFVRSASQLSGESVREHPEIAALRKSVLSHMQGLDVVKVKVYNLQGLTVFSTEARQIGEDKSKNAGYLSARSGKAASELTHRDTFSAFEQTIEDRDVISSYLPIRPSESGPVEGVFELYYDVTPFLKKIKQTQRTVVLGVILVLSGLYGILFLVVGRADRIIRRQDKKLRQYLDEIREANEHLEQRVAERIRELSSINRELQDEAAVRKRAEREIHRLNAELEERVRQLEKSNRVKDEFLSVMSHELRTPITVVSGYAGILQEEMMGKLNAEQAKAVEKIMSRAKDQLIMVNTILLATQMEAGSVKLDSHELHLNGFLENLKSDYDFLPSNGVRLVWDCPDGLPAITTDGSKLRHILQNLISNAVKFTQHGHVKISARTSPETDTIEFDVEDTGMGIEEDLLPVIFEKFRQGDSSETRPYGGVGMGLYIVKKFTELLGGEVGVQSAPGKGSKFTVSIPSGRTAG